MRIALEKFNLVKNQFDSLYKTKVDNSDFLFPIAINAKNSFLLSFIERFNSPAFKSSFVPCDYGILFTYSGSLYFSFYDGAFKFWKCPKG